MNIVLWIAQGLLAVMYLMAGAMKTFMTPRAKTTLTWARDRSDGFVRFIGTSELLGALGLILPLVTGILPWLTVLAAVGLLEPLIKRTHGTEVHRRVQADDAVGN